MNILQVTPFFIPTKKDREAYRLKTFEFAGGAESYILHLSKALIREGHNVEIFTLNLTEKKVDRIILDDLIVHRFPGIRYEKAAISALLFKKLFGAKADIVHAVHIGHPLTLETALTCRIIRKPFVLSHVGTRKFLPFAFFSTRMADRIIIPTKFSFSFFNLLGVADKTEVIPHGVDTEIFHPHRDIAMFRRKMCLGYGPVILFVGRLRWHKGVKHLIEAIPQVLRFIPSAKFVIVGEGEQRPFLEKYTRDLGIHSNVFFTGFVSYEELPLYYSCSDLFVLPSITADDIGHHYPETEAFGIVLLEAMASGLPVIASRVGGVKYVVREGETGFLVDEGNSKQLAEKITQLLLEKKLAKKMRENALNLVETLYSWKIVVKRVLRVFEEVSNLRER